MYPFLDRVRMLYNGIQVNLCLDHSQGLSNIRPSKSDRTDSKFIKKYK